MSRNTSLKELLLESKPMKDSNINSVIICSLPPLGNDIGDKGAEAIAEMLRSNNKLEVLSLYGFS